MSYPNLPKSEYFQGFSAFRSCKASAFLRPQYQKSNKNLSLYWSKIFYRTYFWSIEAKTQKILLGFASILTKSEQKSVYKNHGSDNSFHPKLEAEVNNGGLCQFFVNSSRECSPYVSKALKVIGATSLKELYDNFINSNNIDVNDLSSFKISGIEDFEKQTQRYDFESFDDKFYEHENLHSQIIEYSRNNLEKLLK